MLLGTTEFAPGEQRISRAHPHPDPLSVWNLTLDQSVRCKLSDRRINEISTTNQRILHSLRETISTKMDTVRGLVPSPSTPHLGDELIKFDRLAQNRAGRIVTSDAHR